MYTAHVYYSQEKLPVVLSFSVASRPSICMYGVAVSAVQLHRGPHAIFPRCHDTLSLPVPLVLLSFVGLYYLAQWYAASDPFHFPVPAKPLIFDASSPPVVTGFHAESPSTGRLQITSTGHFSLSCPRTSSTDEVYRS
jgi:hypothetical protein